MIISPAMLHEHLPYVVMEGLNKVRPADRRAGAGAPAGPGGAESRPLSRPFWRGPPGLGERGARWPRAAPRGPACCPACCPPARERHRPPPPASALPQVLENYNKGKTALLSAAKVMVSPTEVDLTPELIFQQQPLPAGLPVPAGLALELPPADARSSSAR